MSNWQLRPETVLAVFDAKSQKRKRMSKKEREAEARADHETMMQLYEHDVDRVAYRIALQEKLANKLKNQHNKNKLNKHFGYSYSTILRINTKNLNETQCLALLDVME